MGDWKLLYPDTRTTILTNWLRTVMGPNYETETEAGDVDDVPDWMKRRDQDNNPKGWRE